MLARPASSGLAHSGFWVIAAFITSYNKCCMSLKGFSAMTAEIEGSLAAAKMTELPPCDVPRRATLGINLDFRTYCTAQLMSSDSLMPRETPLLEPLLIPCSRQSNNNTEYPNWCKNGSWRSHSRLSAPALQYGSDNRVIDAVIVPMDGYDCTIGRISSGDPPAAQYRTLGAGKFDVLVIQPKVLQGCSFDAHPTTCLEF